MREVFDEGEQRNRVPEAVAQQLVRATLPVVTLTPNADHWVTDRDGQWEATTIIAHDVGGRERAIQLLAADGDHEVEGQPVLVVDAGAADLGAFLQAMRAAGCTQTVLITAMHTLANGEVATPEW
eukprot:2924327-Alexandrium_andersonii.AAC.1